MNTMTSISLEERKKQVAELMAGVEEAGEETLGDAEARLEAVRSEMIENDELREWLLDQDGDHYETIVATNSEDALDRAIKNVNRHDYSDSNNAIFVSVRVSCLETDEEDSDTVVLDAEEPDCVNGAEHEWTDSSTQGNGGGVVIREVCRKCGSYQVTDTWAQDPDTGEEGYETTVYEDPDEDSAGIVLEHMLGVAEGALNMLDEVVSYRRSKDDDGAIIATISEDAEIDDLITAIEDALGDDRFSVYEGSDDGEIDINFHQ